MTDKTPSIRSLSSDLKQTQAKSKLLEGQDEQHARFVHLAIHLVGHLVDIKTKSKKTIRGIFHGCTTSAPIGVVLKLSREVLADGSVDLEMQEVLVVPSNELIEISALEISLPLEATAASVNRPERQSNDRRSNPSRENSRNLERWGEDAHNGDTFGSMDGLDGNVGDWDQFEANKRLFGVRSTWNEDMYTKPLDINAVSHRQRKDAERVAREIEREASTTSTSNLHLQEERGIDYADLDEESKYSAVLTLTGSRAGPNPKADRYTVPAKRGGKEKEKEKEKEKIKVAMSVSVEDLEREHGNSADSNEKENEGGSENPIKQSSSSSSLSAAGLPGIKTLGGVIQISNLNPNARTWAPPVAAPSPSKGGGGGDDKQKLEEKGRDAVVGEKEGEEKEKEKKFAVLSVSKSKSAGKGLENGHGHGQITNSMFYMVSNSLEITALEDPTKVSVEWEFGKDMGYADFSAADVSYNHGYSYSGATTSTATAIPVAPGAQHLGRSPYRQYAVPTAYQPAVPPTTPYTQAVGVLSATPAHMNVNPSPNSVATASHTPAPTPQSVPTTPAGAGAAAMTTPSPASNYGLGMYNVNMVHNAGLGMVMPVGVGMTPMNINMSNIIPNMVMPSAYSPQVPQPQPGSGAGGGAGGYPTPTAYPMQYEYGSGPGIPGAPNQ